MSLTRKDIDEIMGLLEGSTFDRLYLEMDGMKLELSRGGSAGRGAARAKSEAPAPALSESPPAQAKAAPGDGSTPPTTAAPQRDAAAEGLVEVKSPLLGVFYRAPKPGEPPFVDVGDRVEEDTVIGITEVMKLMNSARAGIAGEIVQILGTNGEMVEHGEALMLVRPD